MLTDQWYVAMEGLARRGLEVVANGHIKFIPENWSHVYNQWLENIQDWCISRQLWWGHRIPAWYDEEGNIYVARTKEDAYAEYRNRLEKDTERQHTYQKIATLSAMIKFGGDIREAEQLAERDGAPLYVRMRMSSIPGFRPRSGRSPRWAGPKKRRNSKPFCRLPS